MIDSNQSNDATGTDDTLSQALLALPRELAAPATLWAGVEARIEAKRRRTLVVRRSMTGASVLLAAAAVVLSLRFAGSPGPDARQSNRVAPPITSESLPVTPPPRASHDPASPALVPEEASYVTAVAALEATLKDRQKELPEKDAAKVGASLRTIDAAIKTTRSSLAEHPGDADLRTELDAEYEQKIDAMNDVLEWTTRS